MDTVEDVMDERLRGMITCQVCLDILNRPRSLTCFHSFCETCIDGIVRNSDRAGWLRCPSCRKYCIKSDVKPNHQTNRLLDMYHEQQQIKAEQARLKAEKRSSNPNLDGGQCPVCDEGKEAEFKCLQCKMPMCDRCGQAHLRFPVSAEHEVVAVIYLCPEHALKRMNMYCYTCDEGMCQECVDTQHSNHPVVEVEKALQASKVEVTEKLQQMKDVTETREKAVKRQVNCLTKAERKITNQLHTFQRRLIEKINTDISLAHQGLREMVTKRQEVLNSIKKACSEDQQKSQTIHTTYEEVEKTMKDLDLIQSITTIKKLRQEISQKILDWRSNIRDMPSNQIPNLEALEGLLDLETIVGNIEMKSGDEQAGDGNDTDDSLDLLSMDLNLSDTRIHELLSPTHSLASSVDLTPIRVLFSGFVNRSFTYRSVSINKVFRSIYSQDNILWVPDEYENCVKIYSTDLQTRYNRVDHHELRRPLFATTCDNDVLIVAASGLFLVDREGLFRYTIQLGFFVFASWHGDTIVAMKKQSHSLLIFRRDEATGEWAFSTEWDCGFEIRMGDSCVVHGTNVYFVRKTQARHINHHVLGTDQVHRVPLQHRFIHRDASVHICAADEQGSLLLIVSAAATSDYQVLILLPNSQILELPLPPSRNVPVFAHPSCSGYALWMVHECVAGNTLVSQYEFSDEVTQEEQELRSLSRQPSVSS